ncbi:hypothetical protein KYE_21204, partial [Marinobacter manganoxydans MnI7-9]
RRSGMKNRTQKVTMPLLTAVQSMCLIVMVILACLSGRKI